MKKAYILNSCNTCIRILKELEWDGEVQNIKDKHIDAETLDNAYCQVGSYEQLFNKRAMKYRALKAQVEPLTEEGFRKHILGEYTFLKRPFFVIGDKIIAGNSKKVVEEVRQALES